MGSSILEWIENPLWEAKMQASQVWLNQGISVRGK